MTRLVCFKLKFTEKKKNPCHAASSVVPKMDGIESPCISYVHKKRGCE